MFDDRSPIYRQIADKIKADILSGELEADEQVMSTTQYATFFRINPATAAKAFQTLVDEGLLYKRRGVGMFISADAPDTLRAQHRDRFYSDVVDPMIEQADHLGIDLAEVAAHLHQRASSTTADTTGGSE